MRILLINGSARRGNTWQLVKILKERLAEVEEDIAFEEIDLLALDLPMCRGCSLCFRKGDAFCPHRDKMQPLLDSIEQCDGVIFASTCYQMNVTALTKNLTDHLCYLLHRPCFFTKKAIVVSTTGGVGVGGATKFLAGSLRGWGFNRCYKLGVRSYSWNAYVPTPKQTKRAREMADLFYLDVVSGKLHAPTYGALLTYNLFRGMSHHYAPGTEYPTEDGLYWTETGLSEHVYYPKAQLGFFKRVTGTFFHFMGKWLGKYMIVTYKKEPDPT